MAEAVGKSKLVVEAELAGQGEAVALEFAADNSFTEYKHCCWCLAALVGERGR